MTDIRTLDQIKRVADSMDFSAAIEEGFVAYSEGQVVVPPVGEMIFENPPGDTHIKYGYIKKDDYYVIKIASGFYQNAQFNLPSSSGLMLVFSQKTGVLKTVLLDEGYLTDVRTAVAGQIAAKYLAPERITAIGVFGTGMQAKMQVQFLRSVTDCKQLVVCGRSDESLHDYKTYMEQQGYQVKTTFDAGQVTASCNLIVTTTPSHTPLLSYPQVKAGTHITAVGSDTAEKQELDALILENADIIVADSIEQCQQRGEIYQALQSGYLAKDQNRLVELGQVIRSGGRYRSSDEQLTVADLTGVAIQDVQIAKAVCQALES